MVQDNGYNGYNMHMYEKSKLNIIFIFKYVS